MENVNFQPSGEEIERALMDLGPLLGVTIKEEVSEELPDASAAAAAAAAAARLNVGGSVLDGADASAAGSASSGKEGGAEGGADSLASPSAAARSPAGARCVLCTTPLALADGTPKLMECLHSACEPCINAKVEERQANSRDFLGAERITVTCPACRLQCQVANMIDQRFVLEKIAVEQSGSNSTVSGEQQCNSCDDTEPATSYCVDCAEFICDNCVHAHQRLKITKDHTIKSKEEALAELQAAQSSARSSHEMFCRDHVQERLSLFCETCDRLTCRDCQLQHHRDHKYQFSTEMAAQARSNISSLLSEVSYKRVLLGSAMKVIRDRQTLIADKKKALVHEITQTVVKLTNAINTRGKQLVLRLNEVCDAKQRTLAEKKDALEQLAAITDHCVEFVNAALEQGSDTAVLYSKRCVCAHLQRIKSRRADIPNPEIPVRISLALDKLPDLVRVLSSIGAIVVDGKVDGAGGAGGAAGGAQGPYHPPQAPPAAPAPTAPAVAANNPAHSAVVALQHVAMHQSYVQSVSGGGMGGAGVGAVGNVANVANNYMNVLQQSRQRPHTPLRHPHVTSTTHPHHLHGMNEMNLRGLLNAQAARGASPRQLQQQHAHNMQHAYQQMMGAYVSNAFGAGGALVASGGGSGSSGGSGAPACGRRSGGPRTPSPAPAPPLPPYGHHHAHNAHLAHHAPAKWHIPQQNIANGVMEGVPLGGGGSGGADFKITLSRPTGATRPSAAVAPVAVTSTNPKTPSPSLNLNLNGLGPGALELDKVCAESVQDLMATIAKLDSNGVQVVPERAEHAAAARAPGPAPSPAPHVHSSTSPGTPPGKTAGAVSGGSGDPNEDWCAVCMDGGELMCCDKCPKVFHQYCHIPTIEKLPDETETWQCLLCVNFAECVIDQAWDGLGLAPRPQRLVERVTLELYCQYELSLAFREPVPPENLHYHSKITRPMCLDMIRMKLQPRSLQRYTSVSQFVADCRLLFRNAYHYNPPDSSIYKDAKRLEEFFDAQLLKWLPEYAYWSGDGDPPAAPAGPRAPPPAKRARLDSAGC